jgi:putative OPT family oligopeptide transporter
MFSVPLRRALVVDTDLPFPEGRAAAEVLEVGSASRAGGAESSAGLRVIVVNALVAAGFMLLTKMKVVASSFNFWFRAGSGATNLAGSLSLALIGVGHLVGLAVGIAMLIGVIIARGIILPILTLWSGVTGSAEHMASTVFTNQVRFIGAGVIGVAAIWAFVSIIGPVVAGIRSAMASSSAKRSGASLPLVERDMPIGIVTLVSLITLVPMAILLWTVIDGGPLAARTGALIGVSLAFIVVAGVVIAAVAGYMAGLIGSSNSPISGIGILAIIIASLLLIVLFGRNHSAHTTAALVAYGLIVTGMVFGVSAISNDNLQDLKTGHLVGATPWKQQLALVFGVAFGAVVIPPVMNLLNNAFGFAGAPNATENALPAPQAALISSLAKGVIGGNLDWSLIGGGVAIGVVMILADKVLRHFRGWQLPPLAVGIGVYLPMKLTLTVVAGTILGHFYDRWAERRNNVDFAKRLGILAATGMIVGESLFGVIFAGIVTASGTESPLAVVGSDFASTALILGLILFCVLVVLLYRSNIRHASR